MQDPFSILRYILDRGISKDWEQDPLTCAAIHAGNLIAEGYDVKMFASCIVVSKDKEEIAVCVWDDKGIMFSQYEHTPKVYVFLAVTLNTANQLRESG